MKISQANPIIATDTLKKDAGKTTKQLDILENSSQKNLKTLQPSISKIANTLTAQQNVLNLDSLKIGEDGTTSINGEIVAPDVTGIGGWWPDIDIFCPVINNCQAEAGVEAEVEVTNPTATNPTATNPTATNPTATNPTETDPTETDPEVSETTKKE